MLVEGRPNEGNARSSSCTARDTHVSVTFLLQVVDSKLGLSNYSTDVLQLYTAYQSCSSNSSDSLVDATLFNKFIGKTMIDSDSRLAYHSC